MSDFVKANPQKCRKCKYHCNVNQQTACNYLSIMEHSRVFVDGQPAYDPAYCDKYEEGEQVEPDRWIAPRWKAERTDLIDIYVAEVITDAKSTKDYYHRKLMGRSKKWDV